MSRNLRAVTDEERYQSIRNHLTVVSEVLATFEAAFEDNIAVNPGVALNMTREAMKHAQLAFSDASAGTDEIDAIGI